MTIRAVLVDFYGTLARATTWVSADDVLAEHGYALDPEQRAIYFADGLDGVEHDEHSQSRDHYVAWQRERTLAMLAASDVHPGEYETIVEKLRAGAEPRVLEPYDEVPAVLAELRARGLRDRDLLELGLGPARGRRRERPHRRGRRHGVVGVGRRPQAPPAHLRRRARRGRASPPTTCSSSATRGAPTSPVRSRSGFRPLYLRRAGHWPDVTAPPTTDGVAVAPDLTGILDLLDRPEP